MPGLGSQLQNIGTAMAGFSAGLQGQLPQFQQLQQQKFQQEQQNSLLQQEQQAKMVEQRQKTLYTDAAAALQLTKAGRLDDVIKLGVNRLQGLQQLSQQFPDIDPSDTQRVTQLAIAARNGDEEALELLTAELESAVSVGQAIGVLEAPEAPKGATELGKLKQDLDAGLITPEQYETASGMVQKGSLGVVQRFKPGGEAETILMGSNGNFTDLEGNPITLSAQDRIIEGSNLTGGADELGLSNSEATKLRDNEVATVNFLGTVEDALSRIDEYPDVNTFVASAAAVVNNLQQEAKAIGRQFGFEFDESLLSPAEHAEVFEDLGIQNSRMQSLVTSLAYSQALANNPDGRVSNADLNRAIREIGGNAADPAAFKSVVVDIADRTARNFRNNYRVRTGEDFPRELNVPTLTPEAGAAPALTAEERAELESLRSRYGR